MPAVSFKDVDIIFGDNPQKALPLVEEGLSREEILQQTGQVLGVADANLDVNEGEICVLMGLSGSGKSTLLRAVNGLNKVIRGEVLVDDSGKQVDVANCDEDTLRQLRMHKVAMVFQQFALLPWRTVRENVGLGLELQGVSSSEREQSVNDKLQMVGLSDWADKYAHELSGGMQQRVGLARAFVTDAEILLMDEPFSALDPLIRDRLQDELLELQARLNKTIVFVSHDLDEALKIGSRIAIMENGRIVQYDEPENIVLQPANQYVADFVAHMNPLNVLRGSSLMTLKDQLEHSNGGVLVDPVRQLYLTLNDSGGPDKVINQTTTYEMKSAESMLSSDMGSESNILAVANVDQRMKDIIKLRHSTGLPVLMIEDGKFVGVIGDSEIYQGILRQSEVNL